MATGLILAVLAISLWIFTAPINSLLNRAWSLLGCNKLIALGAITNSALNTNATTALAGAEARYRGIPKTTLFASAGVETDTNTANGSYSATGVTGLTPVNFNPNPVKTRPTATVGGYYDITKSQRFGVTGIYRQEPFQAVSTTTVLATYTIGLWCRLKR